MLMMLSDVTHRILQQIEAAPQSYQSPRNVPFGGTKISENPNNESSTGQKKPSLIKINTEL